MVYYIKQNECLAELRTMPENSIDSIVTDPPYGINFMGKKWDYDVPSIEVWKECLRVLKPGGHMLVACGTRTQHRMVVPIEDAGFEIRDVITWLYGSGFPKSLNIGKAIDKEAGAVRKQGALKFKGGTQLGVINDDGWEPKDVYESEPATDAAKQWDGWGTAIKPACEFWTLCRKPLSESTVAKNVLKWGTGGINIDGCRVETDTPRPQRVRDANRMTGNAYHGGQDGTFVGSKAIEDTTQGRFPSNLILDEEAAAALDEQSGISKSPSSYVRSSDGSAGLYKGSFGETSGTKSLNFGDSGGASRFFYCAKASKSDRGEGNNHPTVKPTNLMAYLCKLVTPPNGVVLDPFAGSGSTGVGALREGFRFMGIERDTEYVKIIKKRLESMNINLVGDF